MKRTFFAVKASNQTQKVLNEITQGFPEFHKKIKIANPGNPHITLKFLGDTKLDDIPKIDEILRNAITTIPPFTSVLWLGITEGLNYLISLHNLLERELEKFGYAPDNRDFKPHLTYGRIRKQYRKLNSIKDFENLDYGHTINTVEKVIWFESILTSKGALHKPLRQYQLNKISGGENG